MRNIDIEPTVSIIIPTKNEERNIASCLNGIQQIEYPKNKIDVVVVDNGSNDDTVKIAKALGAKVLVMPDMTIAGLRNKGVQESEGEIIGFIDGDVIVDRCWLEASIYYFKSKNVICVGASPDIPLNATWVEKSRYLNVEAKPDVWESKWICSMNMLIRRSIFNEAGGFDERLITCEDVDLGYRISLLDPKYKIIRDKRICATHTGEAKTIFQLFKKERWRATSNFSGVFYHGIILHEIPSLVIPLFHTALFLLSVIFIAMGKISLTILLLFVAGIVPLIRTFKVLINTRKYNKAHQVFIIQLTYEVARVFSVFDRIFLCGLNK